ncbi:MAG TPA: arginine--tRNA ligase [candidate division Zixibacteria bacterium]|jgi:arginyl-tRNA synthetase
MTSATQESIASYLDDACRATADGLARLGAVISVDAIAASIEYPNRKDFGDVAVPCFPLAQSMRLAPAVIAQRLSETFVPPGSITRVKAIGGYFNLWFDPQAIADVVLPRILAEKSGFGSSTLGRGKTICMDYSHPNIAKPFGVGHLRSTVIGHALKNILEKLGYTTVGINHLGDWGTQFGKLIVAFRDWGSEETIAREPIRHLYDLYVRFHQEAESNPSLDERARAEFRKLEDGDPDNRALWKRFRDLSLQEFQRVYSRLGVTFDSDAGEAFYNDQLSPLIDRMVAVGAARVGDDGALVVDVGQGDEPPLLLRKADGATLYATRDLAAAEYRHNTYGFDRCLYIVGSAQALHFKQLFAALKKMGHDWADSMIHVDFGWVKFGDEMMSTRRGNIVFLDEVLSEAVERARTIIAEKNPDLDDAGSIADAVGIGAVVFWQLSARRQRDVNFTWQDALSFDGRTGPYLQYTHARICSLIERSGQAIPQGGFDSAALSGDDERRVLLQLADWPRRIRMAAEQYEPHILAGALLDLAQTYNSFYQRVRILDGEESARIPRLCLSQSVRWILAEGLRLLGLRAPERM